MGQVLLLSKDKIIGKELGRGREGSKGVYIGVVGGGGGSG